MFRKSFRLYQGKEEFLEVESSFHRIEFEIVETLIAARERYSKFIHAHFQHSIPMLYQYLSSLKVSSVDISKAGEWNFDELHNSIADGLISFWFEQSL